MFSRRQFTSRMAALSATLAVSPGSAFAAAQTLRFASFSGGTSDHYVLVLEPFARGIEAASNGRLEMALKPVGGYGKPAELIPMIERGDIELANSIQGYYPGRFPQSSVIELPMLFADAVTGSRALMALYREGLLDKDYAALKVLSLSVAPPCSIFTTGKKITTTRDLRGLRIRVPSPTVGLPLARLGAIPLGMPLSMIGEAIANGTINAMAFALDAGIGFKGANGKPIADDMSVVLDLDFAAPAVMTVMNRAAWDALPSDLQVTLETGGAAAGMEAAQVSDRGQAFAREKFKANPNYTYILPSTELRAEFQSTMVRSFDDWQTNMNRTGIDGARLLTRTRELVKQYAVAEK